MKTKLRILAVALLAGGTMLAQPRLSIGIGVGGYGPGYYQPPAYSQYMPPCPGPDYSWVDGYWAPQRGRNVWISGFWRHSYGSRYRSAPRYTGPGYYNSYRGNDRDRDRYQNRGGDRREERRDDRGQGWSNGFRR